MWALAVNPTAGSGNGAIVARSVAAFLTNKGIDHEIISGNSAIALLEHLKRFISKNPQCEGVLAVGGDGLVHNILQVTTPLQIPMAPIPAGTGNDFARTLGWSISELERYLEKIFNSEPTSIDLGVVDGEWFGAILSTGFDSIVNEKANTMSWPKGPMKYNAAIAIELPRFKPRHYEITLDDRTISTQAMLIAVSNGRSYGGGMLVCPEADLHDGLFDVMVLHPISKMEFIKVFPRVFKGTHVTHPAVEIVRSKKVRIQAEAIAYADGERISQLPVEATCMSGAMQGWVR